MKLNRTRITLLRYRSSRWGIVWPCILVLVILNVALHKNDSIHSVELTHMAAGTLLAPRRSAARAVRLLNAIVGHGDKCLIQPIGRRIHVDCAAVVQFPLWKVDKVRRQQATGKEAALEVVERIVRNGKAVAPNDVRENDAGVVTRRDELDEIEVGRQGDAISWVVDAAAHCVHIR